MQINIAIGGGQSTYCRKAGETVHVLHKEIPTRSTSLLPTNLQVATCMTVQGVFIRWTGMDHWTAGMDYWNGLLEHACHKFEVSMTIVHMHACMHAHC